MIFREHRVCRVGTAIIPKDDKLLVPTALDDLG